MLDCVSFALAIIHIYSLGPADLGSPYTLHLCQTVTGTEKGDADALRLRNVMRVHVGG